MVVIGAVMIEVDDRLMVEIGAVMIEVDDRLMVEVEVVMIEVDDRLMVEIGAVMIGVDVLLLVVIGGVMIGVAATEGIGLMETDLMVEMTEEDMVVIEEGGSTGIEVRMAHSMIGVSDLIDLMVEGIVGLSEALPVSLGVHRADFEGPRDRMGEAVLEVVEAGLVKAVGHQVQDVIRTTGQDTNRQMNKVARGSGSGLKVG
jgi:hypothetical protein